MNPSIDPAFIGLSKKDIQYMEVFHGLLSSSTNQLDIDQVLIEFRVGPSTVKKYLRKYLDIRPHHIERIVGFYPSAETVIRLAEVALGPITGENLNLINHHCKATIDAITRPKHKRFLDMLLQSFLEPDGITIRIDQDSLTELIYSDYVDFVHEADNGLVSIAGSMNEKILMKGLANAGLIIGDNVKKTGNDSEADMQVEHRGRTTKIMYCEVKSYAARERLLRGLQDINHPEKVGVGFFNNSTEFNPERTRTLLAANPLAIYMPDVTLDKVPIASKIQTTRYQDKLYRPLSMFINDMVYFKDAGELPKYM